MRLNVVELESLPVLKVLFLHGNTSMADNTVRNTSNTYCDKLITLKHF